MNDEPVEPASLRLPARLSATLRKRAKENRRSLNSEVIVILEKILGDPKESEAA